ncbi:MAG: DUF2271 domain-containing protein [Actinobacteria bacterium]|nr:DUF2271 domain-containing protein [Actinomycetota bacterium]
MQQPKLPRYDAMVRREFLKRAAALGAVALAPGALAACSKDDKDVFADAGDTTTSTTAAASGTSTADGSSTTTTGGSSSGSALPDGAQVEVAFTYAAETGGQGPARNPFIAVWVETAAGDLVANLALWYNPPKGDRWINNLSAWYAADGAYYDANGTDDVESITGATRPAGTYTVVWDGLDAAGERAPQGDYVFLVESAREHGPHSLTSGALALAAAAADVALADDGELSAATATYAV